MENFDIVIIGAGPSGSCAGSLLVKHGFSVCVIEKELFPRFSIGESLLPHCMEFLEEAELLDVFDSNVFQYKDGAAFYKKGLRNSFDFGEKNSIGPSTTFQVKRNLFDKALADGAETKGVEIRYQQTVQSYQEVTDGVQLTILTDEQQEYALQAKFVLDASGFGRVLPKLLNLEVPSDFPVRKAVFSHFKDNIKHESFDRNKILITVHPKYNDIWYWLIPFADGTSSIGVVGGIEQLTSINDESLDDLLWRFILADDNLEALLVDAELIAPARTLSGYSANVTQLAGKRFALLGNAGEFLDPVFSSGVTIALRSASQVTPLVVRALNNEAVDWEQEYSVPLRQGISTFKCFVEAWYDGRLQDIIFHPTPDGNVKKMVCSVLAGYAWDQNNPFVLESNRRLNTLAEVCRD